MLLPHSLKWLKTTEWLKMTIGPYCTSTKFYDFRSEVFTRLYTFDPFALLDELTQDKYPVGDLTSRHKDLSAAADKPLIDHNLPLIGRHKIAGSSIKVVLDSGDVLCSKLKKDSVKPKKALLPQSPGIIYLLICY